MKKYIVHIILYGILTIHMSFLATTIAAQGDTIQAVIVFDCIPTFDDLPIRQGDTIFAYTSVYGSDDGNSGSWNPEGVDSILQGSILLNGQQTMNVHTDYMDIQFAIFDSELSCYSTNIIYYVDQARNTADSLFITFFNAKRHNISYPTEQVCWNESAITPLINPAVNDLIFLSRSELSIDQTGNIYPQESIPGSYLITFESDYCLSDDSVNIQIIGGLDYEIQDTINYCTSFIGQDQPLEISLNSESTDSGAVYIFYEQITEEKYYRITDSFGCESYDSFYVSIIEPLNLEITQTERCNSVLIEMEPVDRELLSIDWSDISSATYAAEIFESQIVNIEVRDEYGCLTTKSVDVQVRPLTVESIDYLKSESDCWYDGQLNINSSEVYNASGNTNYELRNTLNGDVVTNLEQIPEGIYTIEAIDDRDCRVVYPEKVTIYQKCLEDYPVITANEDGDEDEYFIPYEGIVKIYDREGKLINKIETPAYWDGRNFDGVLMPMGNYVMIADNGRTVDITLIR